MKNKETTCAIWKNKKEKSQFIIKEILSLDKKKKKTELDLIIIKLLKEQL